MTTSLEPCSIAATIEQLRNAQHEVMLHAVALSQLQPFDAPQNQLRASQRLGQFYSALMHYTLLGEAKAYPEMAQTLESHKLDWQTLCAKLQHTGDTFLSGQENYDRTPNKSAKEYQQSERDLEAVLNSFADRTQLEAALVKLFKAAQKHSLESEAPTHSSRPRP